MAVSVASCLGVLLCICTLQTLAHAQTMHLTYFAQELRGGPNATLLPAAGTGQGNFSALGWGSILVFDNMLKQGPQADSKLLGRITGTGALTTIGGIATGGVQVVSKFWFGDASKYNGSSLQIVGTLSYPMPPWELIVVGGTGHFRGYYGYALSQPVVETSVAPLYVYKWDFYISKT